MFRSRFILALPFALDASIERTEKQIWWSWFTMSNERRCDMYYIYRSLVQTAWVSYGAIRAASLNAGSRDKFVNEPRWLTYHGCRKHARPLRGAYSRSGSRSAWIKTCCLWVTRSQVMPILRIKCIRWEAISLNHLSALNHRCTWLNEARRCTSSINQRPRCVHHLGDDYVRSFCVPYNDK